MPASSDDFKQVLSRWASGVSVVTTNDGGMVYGLTVSSFASVSLDPPLVSVCLSDGNRIVEMIGRSGIFAVSILGDTQQEASNYFAKPNRVPAADITEVPCDRVEMDLPVVSGSIAWACCRVHASFAQGDHTIVVGHVEATGTAEGSPLLYFDRAYRTVQS